MLLKEAVAECDQDSLPVTAFCMTASPIQDSTADIVFLFASCQAQGSEFLSKDLARQEFLTEVRLSNPPVGYSSLALN